MEGGTGGGGEGEAARGGSRLLQPYSGSSAAAHLLDSEVKGMVQKLLINPPIDLNVLIAPGRY